MERVVEVPRGVAHLRAQVEDLRVRQTLQLPALEQRGELIVKALQVFRLRNLHSLHSLHSPRLA